MIQKYKRIILLFFILFISVSYSYPPPIQSKKSIEITKNITKEYIIKNHMKYSNHQKYHNITYIGHITRYHERSNITIPLFNHIFTALAFDHIRIRSSNGKYTVIDENPFKNITLSCKRLIVLKASDQSITFTNTLLTKLKPLLTQYDGVLMDTSMSSELSLELSKAIHNMMNSIYEIQDDSHTITLQQSNQFLIYVIKPLHSQLTEYIPYVTGIILDTQYYDPTAVTYQPLQPSPWIDEQMRNHFPKNTFNPQQAGFILNFEGRTYCKYSTNTISNLAFLRFIKKMNVTITYHSASHEHSFEAIYKSEKYADDYCKNNYPTPFSLSEKLKIAEKYSYTVLIHAFGGGLDYFFDIL